METTVGASHVRDALELQSCKNRCLHYTVNIVKPLCLDSLQSLNFGLLYFIFRSKLTFNFYKSIARWRPSPAQSPSSFKRKDVLVHTQMYTKGVRVF